MLQNTLKIFFDNLLTGGRFLQSKDFEIREELSRIIFINIIALLGFMGSSAQLLYQLARGQYNWITPFIIAPPAFLALFLYLRKIENSKLGSSVIVFMLLVSVPICFLVDSFSKYNSFILFSYPLAVFYLMGKRKSLAWILLLLLAYASMMGLVYFKVIVASFSLNIFGIGFINLILISVFAYLREDREEKTILRMKTQLYRDPLTELPNRALLLKHISAAQSPALLLLNIDDFKEINATYGYRVGDSVLQSTAEKLTQIVPDNALGVYRLGGDEFAVLMDKQEDSRYRKTLTNIAKLITRFLHHEKCVVYNAEIRIRISLGIALADDVGVEKLFACADIAMKTAKETNKPFLFYKQALKTKKRYEENIKWANILADALDNNRVVPYYQPIFNNATGEIVKYECLARLIDYEGQVVPPYFFLDIAKRTRLYTKVTKAVLRRAFEFLKTNNSGVSINLCVIDLLDQTVLDYINRLLNEHHSLRSRVCFEITESEGIENFDQVSHFIGEMKEKGCEIAIDDFGTGYSNFDYLMHLDVDYLKIDGSLIKNIDEDDNSRIIVEKLVAFTQQLDFKTIAEYVHSEKVFKEVKKLNIDCSQGNYLGEPKPAMMHIISGTDSTIKVV